ncbi:MAG TPA: non-homologous end-joining DNA ligase [Micromonosporaceae bacterium]|nr:non-homologous end-joining DNA ligase [Micromonosporaceae bacterium]
MAARKEVLTIGEREVSITNPDKVYFPQTGHTKMDLVRYYVTTADAVLRGVYGRPMALKRYVNGIAGEAFFQKRAPQNRPEWIETVELKYPSGRSADEVVVREPAALAWLANLGCIDLHPHPVRAEDLEHPDELRVDLDPIPGVGWAQVREVALIVRDTLADYGLVGWPKTSGSRGLHIYCRIHPQWTFRELHRAAMALAREVEERAPDLATSRWWKEERHGVFVDYNQNARDRTTTSAYSVRPTADARVSTPLAWDEVADCDPAAFTIDTVPRRLAEVGDPAAGMDDAAGSLAPLLELAERLKEQGKMESPPRRHGRVAQPAPGKTSGASGRRRSTMPLLEIARAASKAEAEAGLDRWRERHPEVWPYLAPADILVDAMRGRSSAWYRIRVNLRNVPEELRPEQGPLEVDYDPWAGQDPRRTG